MLKEKPHITCMKDLWRFIESKYESDVASLNVVRNGDLLCLHHKGKLKAPPISKILIDCELIEDVSSKNVAVQVSLQRVFTKFITMCNHLNSNKITIHDFINTKFSEKSSPICSSPPGPGTSSPARTPS